MILNKLLSKIFKKDKLEFVKYFNCSTHGEIKSVTSLNFPEIIDHFKKNFYSAEFSHYKKEECNA